MAAGGGGAWKVAYADFVTAMMAFFLVMWIVGQDQKVRKSVADYFSDPMAMPDDGTGNKPVRLGAAFDGINNGKIPGQEGVQKQHGSNVFGKTHEFSPNTKVVYDWIMEDQKAHSHWQKESDDQREYARWSADVQKEGKTIEQVAARRLANQLREEMLRDVPKGMSEVHRNLLLRSITQDVNWEQIAKVLVQR